MWRLARNAGWGRYLLWNGNPISTCLIYALPARAKRRVVPAPRRVDRRRDARTGRLSAWGVCPKRRRASRSCFLIAQTFARSKPICNRQLARAALERPRPPRTSGNKSRTAARLPGGSVGSTRQQINARSFVRRQPHAFSPHRWHQCVGSHVGSGDWRLPHVCRERCTGPCRSYRSAQLPPVVNGRAGVSANMAPALEEIGWGTADHWMRMQASYELAQARRARAVAERRAREWHAWSGPRAGTVRRWIVPVGIDPHTLVEKIRLLVHFGRGDTRAC